MQVTAKYVFIAMIPGSPWRKLTSSVIAWNKEEILDYSRSSGQLPFWNKQQCKIESHWFSFQWWAVWPDWAIYCTLGYFSKPVARFICPKLLTFSVNFCKGVKISNYSSEIFLGNFYRHLATFYWSHWTLFNLLYVDSPSSFIHLRQHFRHFSKIYFSNFWISLSLSIKMSS